MSHSSPALSFILRTTYGTQLFVHLGLDEVADDLWEVKPEPIRFDTLTAEFKEKSAE